MRPTRGLQWVALSSFFVSIGCSHLTSPEARRPASVPGFDLPGEAVAVVCKEGERIKSAETLAEFEARVFLGIRVEALEGDTDSILKGIVSQVRRSSEALAQALSAQYNADLADIRAKKQVFGVVYVDREIDLSNRLPKGCGDVVNVLYHPGDLQSLGSLSSCPGEVGRVVDSSHVIGILTSKEAPGRCRFIESTSYFPSFSQSSRAWLLTQIAIQKIASRRGQLSHAATERGFRYWVERLFSVDDVNAAKELATKLGF